MNYRDTIEYREYSLSYYRDSEKSTIAQPYLILHTICCDNKPFAILDNHSEIDCNC